MIRPRALALASLLLASLPLSPAAAEPLLPPPGDPAFSAPLLDLANAYQRQQDVFCTRENGLSLDVYVDPAEVDTVKSFFAQGASDDFQAVTGLHPYDVVLAFGEHGDEGNFAGIASVGQAARLMELRRLQAPEAEIAKARDAVLRAVKAWTVYGAIGGPGVVARGVRRVVPWDAADPPFPGDAPQIVPLKDGNGDPLPASKEAVWRGPVDGGFGGWAWLDDTSKDQVSGYALGTMWLWDALVDEPTVDPKVRDKLANGLVEFARALMKVAPETGTDLCIRDADGRLTSFFDLNPRQISPDGTPLPPDSSLQNGFNAALALGIVRAAYHVSGDYEIGKYYYEELVGKRDLPAIMANTAGLIFLGASTNYSNVNMLAIALATLGRVETDPYVRQRLQETLDTQFWSTGSTRDVEHSEQAWFDAVYGGYSATPPAGLRGRVENNLGGFQTAPAFERDRVNCDDAEIAAGVCTAVDGSTMIVLDSGKGHGGGVVAKDIVPMSVRPDSDFHWRSDPHQVNGSASSSMDPGGDYLAAYWLARSIDIDDTTKNLSPFARPPLAYTPGGEGGSGGAGGAGGAGGSTVPGQGGEAGGSPDTGGGCSCRTSERDSGDGAMWASVLLLTAAAGRRRRSPRPSPRR